MTPLHRNPCEDDETPHTCHDCDAALGAEPYVGRSRSPIGTHMIYLCRECADAQDASHGDDDAALDAELDDLAWGER